jgi:ribosomal protein L37AE/L43A
MHAANPTIAATAPNQRRAAVPAPGMTAGPQPLPCPRCSASTVHRREETEWITLYECRDCHWTFAKSIDRSRNKG